jgi:CheY-like chemotaxis protein
MQYSNGRTILLAEDEHQQRDALTMLFETEGYTVLSYESAEDVLGCLATTRPGMIVTDVKLPGIDGFTLFERVRENPSYRSIPFVFLTAYNDRKAIEKAKNLGAVGYLTKPYNLEELLQLVKKVLPVS